MDMQKCIDYIYDKTGIDPDLLELILDLETDYMMEAGIIKVSELTS